MPKGFRAQVPDHDGDPNELYEEMIKKASDFNFSCRDFARESGLTLEARLSIIDHAGNCKPDFEQELALVAKT